MITLVTYPAGFGQLSFSPFCVKAIWLMQAAGVDWQREDCNDPRKFPHAKLPAIKTPSGIIGDSHEIQAYLEGLGADFWGKVSDRTIGHAFIRMAEEHMYFHIVLDRWGNDQIWPIIRENYFSEVPKLLRRPVTGTIRKGLLKGMQAQGLGRLSDDERIKKIEPDLRAISTRLKHHNYLMGDEISLPDYSVAAMLGAMLASPLPTALSERVSKDTVLTDYASRVADGLAPA
ncbi:MAG: Tom37 metaxin N-terminal-like domain-containing protein [Pseudomonadota bacterium]